MNERRGWKECALRTNFVTSLSLRIPTGILIFDREEMRGAILRDEAVGELEVAKPLSINDFTPLLLTLARFQLSAFN